MLLLLYILRDHDLGHKVPRSVAKYCCRVHRTSPPWMRQDLAEASIVCSIIQQDLHPIHLGVNLVAILGQHGKTRARVDIVSPVPRLPNLAAQLLSEFHKAIQQPILLGFYVLSNSYQIVPSVLIGGNGQHFEWCCRHRQRQRQAATSHDIIPVTVPVRAEVFVTKNVLEFSHQGFRKRVQTAFDGIFLPARSTGKTRLYDSRHWLGHDR
mmetsp:Transcript_28091/g.60421  ORF Transcript_28091/g.60421 Transcript_28091/m.60421 type:complete len:210 (-) Transcript_28091:112-741(-)